jgi:alkylation response protein AidB-like acyl-CoA dehydrogenase
VAIPHCEAKPDGDGFRLDGVKTHVIDAATADELVVTAAVEGVPGAFVVPADRVRHEPMRGLDVSRPLGTVHLDGVHVSTDRRLGGAADPAVGIRRVLEVATVALAAETLGTCQVIFDLTLDYAKVREQFDRPIGSFQALKHQFADQYVALERTRAVILFAAMTLAEDDPRRALAAAMAKAAAGDAQRRVVAGGIQLHGGIAYTWEHDVQLLVKRAMVGDALLGNAPLQRQRIADLLELPRVPAA